jgi:aerobic carbon-monoxide dehydrogenase large subunit
LELGDDSARAAGARLPRVEDARLLTGRGVFVDDISLPRMRHACFVRSPFARARIASVDVSASLSLDGVCAVFLAADLNPWAHEQWHTSHGPDAPEVDRPPLAERQVRFAGDLVALVVADTRYIAEDAVDLVDVDYEPLSPLLDYTTADEAPDLVHSSVPANLVGQAASPDGAMVGAVFATAPYVVSETFQQHRYLAVPMEPRGMVVDWDPASEEMTIWASTQSPHEVRLFCSRLVGVPENRIRVIMRDTGGGFGQKVFVQREEMCVMLAARKVPGPLKWMEDRRENLIGAGQSRHEGAHVRMAFAEDGAILAASIDHVQDAGAYPTPTPARSGAVVCALFPGPYRVPALRFSTRATLTNTMGRSPYRGPWQFESLAREVLLDIAARRLGLDPVDLRRRNLLRAEDLPYTNPAGMTFDYISPLQTLEQALEMLDYQAFRRQQAAARDVGRYLGVGTCTYVEPTTAGFGMYGSEGATIRVEPSGKVNVYVAGGSTGNSIETTVIQLVADGLGVDVADVATIQGDTALTPFGAGTGGSRSGSMTAGAVGATTAVLRAKVIELAAHRLEAAREDLDIRHGVVSVVGSPTSAISLAELAWIAHFVPEQRPAGMDAGLEASSRYTTPTPFIWANATHLCTCEVDACTGAVSLLRYIVSEDCGPMINPNIVEGQIAGGTVQGIGGALYEDMVYDDDGNPLSTTLMDYLLPTAAEVPLIEYGHVETWGPGPGGYKGVGEGGCIGSPPAVVNAVADALSPFGANVTTLPLTPSSILALINGRPRATAAPGARAAR